MPSLSPGTLIDGTFELLRPIGEGGMGEVWLARDRTLGRDVALKAMRPSDSASRTRRFEREARALAALDHPSILPVL
ncbi:MAG: protein kinase, partial [Kiritimatiellae bacterium]|nr:protein kinase [Kiritimatiellia bacterium]